MISKIIQDKILNGVFKIQKRYKLSDKTMFTILYVCHHIHVVLVSTVLIFISDPVVMILNFIYILFVLILFNFFHGCIITKMEQKLEQNDIIIGDICLDILNIDKTYNNRVLSAGSAIVFSICMQLYKILVPNSILHF